jgi:cell division septation protein DedD
VQGGRWRVSVLRTADQDEALKSFDALRGAGFDARIRATRAGQDNGYDVGIGRLSSEAEARGLAARLAGLPGVGGQVSIGR